MNPFRLQAIKEVGFEEGFRKAASAQGLSPLLADQMLKAARYGDMSAGDIAGTALKYGIGAPTRLLTAPLSIPTAIGEAGGAIAGLKEMGNRQGVLQDGSEIPPTMLHPATAGLGERMHEIAQQNPELAEELMKHFKSLPDSATGTSAGALGLGMAGRGVGHLATWGLFGPASAGLFGAGQRAGGQGSFLAGLGGAGVEAAPDEPWGIRGWMDPAGYQQKQIAYELSQDNPELAERIRKTLLASEA